MVPASVALMALGADVVEEVHLDGDRTLAVAGRARAVGVEAEGRSRPARGLGEDGPDVVEDPEVGGRVGPAAASDGRLVHDDGVRVLREEDVVHQRALAAAGHARDADEDPLRDVDVDPVEVVGAGSPDGPRLRPGPAGARDGCGGVPDERRRLTVGREERLAGPGEADRAAGAARAGADLDDVIGGGDHRRVVFHDEHRVPRVAQASEHHEQRFQVAGMQADRRFVQHVHHAGEITVELPRHLDALALAAGQGRTPPGPARGSRRRS